MRFRSRVMGWTDAGSEKLHVRLDDGSVYETRKLAICMGAWFVPIAREIGVPLVVQRNVQHWFAPAPGDYGPLEVPTFLIERDSQPALMYGFPDAGSGVKAALHTWGQLTTADELDRDVTENDIAPVREALEAWIPGATHRYLRGKACTYTLTPDEHFVLGMHPFDDRIVLAGGFSGHGFKFASVIGEVVSDLLVDGATSHDIAFLSPTRFHSSN
jgi:sarcosine oxidase